MPAEPIPNSVRPSRPDLLLRDRRCHRASTRVPQTNKTLILASFRCARFVWPLVPTFDAHREGNLVRRLEQRVVARLVKGDAEGKKLLRVIFESVCQDSGLLVAPREAFLPYLQWGHESGGELRERRDSNPRPPA